MTFKPLLAATLTKPEALQFPIIASPKLDGVRCLVIDGVAMSRSLKPIPNLHVQRLLAPFSGLDGELMVDGLDYNGVQSAVMSVNGMPNIVFYIFDRIDDSRPYAERLEALHTKEWLEHPPVDLLEYRWIHDLQELMEYEELCVRSGYEGVMLRSPEGVYKHGRSTERECILLKMKRFHDMEGEIIGFEERMHNGNAAEVDNLGRTKRSSAKQGMVGRGDLGSLSVTIDGTDGAKRILSIGSGFTDAQRAEFWSTRESLLGKFVTFKYQELSAYGVPRFPVFKCIREI